MGKKILITGGAGFIGTNAARHFIERDFEVTILDNLSRKASDINLENLKSDYSGRFKFVKADVTEDGETLRNLVASTDVVLHLAAQVAVTTSVVNPREDFNINALGTFNILEAARTASSMPMVLYSSTNKVYGHLSHRKVREEATRYVFEDSIGGIAESEPLDFHSPYGCSKGSADQYVRDYARIYGLPTVVFRQSCIYGPQQFGVEDQGWVAWFAVATLLGRPITLYGNGKQVRDLLHVSDLCALYEKAINKGSSVSGEVYNAGGGEGNTISILELLPELERLTGKKIERSFAPTRPGDQPLFCADIAKAKADFDWQPTTNVSTGVERMVRWLEEKRGVLDQIYS